MEINMTVIYPLISVIIVSLISVLIAFPFFFKKKISQKFLLMLLSVSVGVLLTTVFMDFLPEVMNHDMNISVPLYILLGFMVMFIIEKFVHYHHNKKYEDGHCGHGHAYNLAPINLIGDGVHNFIDGLVIAGAYAVNVAVGLAATISIIFHEIPQEMADFGVLLYSGYSKKKAMAFNFLSATTAIIGTLMGLYLTNIHGFTKLIIPFAAGNFIYIAASNLTPQLHRHCSLKESIVHIASIIVGIAIVVLITLYTPGHSHV